MKNFNLTSFLAGLVVGVLLGAGAMSLAGGSVDNTDLQGRLGGSFESAESLEVKELPEGFYGASTCTDDTCDIMDELEEIRSDGVGGASWTLEAIKDSVN